MAETRTESYQGECYSRVQIPPWVYNAEERTSTSHNIVYSWQGTITTMPMKLLSFSMIVV